MSILSDQKERTRFIKFAVVGAIGFVVDFTSYNLFRSLLKIIPEASSVLSFIAAVTSNFIWNRYWTYPDSRSKPIMGQLIQFSVVNIAGLAIRTVVFAMIHEPLSDFFASLPIALPIPSYLLGENLALAIVVILVMFWNFFVNRYWTYNDVD